MQIYDIQMELNQILKFCSILDSVSEFELKKEIKYINKNDLSTIESSLRFSFNELKKGNISFKSNLSNYWIDELCKAFQNHGITEYDEVYRHFSECAATTIPSKRSLKEKVQVPDTLLNIIDIYCKIKLISTSLSSLYKDDLMAPIPPSYYIEDESNHNLCIRSYKHNQNLNILSKDLTLINKIIEATIQLVDNSTEGNSPKYTIRYLSTGSLNLVITTYLALGTTIATFIFFVIKEIQQTRLAQLEYNKDLQDMDLKEREMDLKEREIKIREKEINLKLQEIEQNDFKLSQDALIEISKIIGVDASNDVVQAHLQTTVAFAYEYLNRNTSGSINGQEYDISEDSNNNSGDE